MTGVQGMTIKSGILRGLWPGAVFLLLQISCTNYSATELEKSAVPPIAAPEVETKSANIDRLIQNANRLTSAIDEQNSAIPDDQEDAFLQAVASTLDVRSLDIVKNLVPNSSPRFAALARESFKRIQLDTGNSFSIMDAVALTVQFNRDIKTSYAQYQQSLGSLETARGAFDLTVQAEWNSTPSFSFAGKDSTNETDTSLYSFGVSRLSRFGLQTDVTFSYTGQDFFAHSGDSELGEGDIALVFSMPIFKESGTVSTAAEEQANILALEASLASVIHQINTSLNTMVGNYWNYVAAVQNLLLSIEALERSQETLENTKILVENDFQESSSLHALMADVASKESSRQYNEQQLAEARNSLAIELGFPVKIAHRLSMPTSHFTEIEMKNACLIKSNLPLLHKTAQARRQDNRSAELQMKSAQVMEAKYRRDILPDVNMIAGVTQTGFSLDNSLSEAFDAASDGESAIKAGIQMAIPWTNDTARGQLRSQLGQTWKLRLAYLSTQESIASDIDDNVNALFYAVEILKSQELAEKQYLEATDAEYQKFKLGLSSVLDIINVSNSLTASRGNTVNARANLATAITQLRYSTGTLLNDNKNENKLLFEDLTTPLPHSLLTQLSTNGTCE